MQYTGDQPRVFLMNLETGQRELVGNFPGMTFSPRFSPDGQRVIMSIGEGGATSIVEMDLRSAEPPSDPIQRHRHQSLLQPRRAPHRVRIGPRWLPAALRHERRRLRPAPHQLRRGPLLDARMVAARRPHRLHQAVGGQFPDRRHAPGRLRRAHLDGGLPQRGSDLGPQRPCSDVLPRKPRRRRARGSFPSISPATTSARCKRPPSAPIPPGRPCEIERCFTRP